MQEAGYKNEPIKFKYGGRQCAFDQYAQVIQNSLNEVGLNVEIETLEVTLSGSSLRKGNFRCTPVSGSAATRTRSFYGTFSGRPIPGGNVAVLQSRPLRNPNVDKLVEEAINEIDRERQKSLYKQAWDLISDDLPLLPLWYPANMVVCKQTYREYKDQP